MSKDAACRGCSTFTSSRSPPWSRQIFTFTCHRTWSTWRLSRQDQPRCPFLATVSTINILQNGSATSWAYHCHCYTEFEMRLCQKLPGGPCTYTHNQTCLLHTTPICLRTDGTLSGNAGSGASTCNTPTRHAPMFAIGDPQNAEATFAGGPPMMLPHAYQNASMPTSPYSTMMCNKVRLP